MSRNYDRGRILWTKKELKKGEYEPRFGKTL